MADGRETVKATVAGGISSDFTIQGTSKSEIRFTQEKPCSQFSEPLPQFYAFELFNKVSAKNVMKQKSFHKRNRAVSTRRSYPIVQDYHTGEYILVPLVNSL